MRKAVDFISVLIPVAGFSVLGILGDVFDWEMSDGTAWILGWIFTLVFCYALVHRKLHAILLGISVPGGAVFFGLLLGGWGLPVFLGAVAGLLLIAVPSCFFHMRRIRKLSWEEFDREKEKRRLDLWEEIAREW